MPGKESHDKLNKEQSHVDYHQLDIEEPQQTYQEGFFLDYHCADTMPILTDIQGSWAQLV